MHAVRIFPHSPSLASSTVAHASLYKSPLKTKQNYVVRSIRSSESTWTNGELAQLLELGVAISDSDVSASDLLLAPSRS